MAKKRNSIGRSLDRIQRAAQGKSSPLSKDAATDGVRTVFRLTNFEVTWDVMPDRELEALPQATRDRMAELYEMMNERPHSFIAELRELSTKHPGVSCLRNWFINALRCGSPSERAEARTVSEWLFHDRPDYFFARTMLAELCLEAGELGKAADLVFGENTALTTLYPERTVFHISEIRHWGYVCGKIKIMQGDPENAEDYRNMLEDLEPGSHAVKELDRLLKSREALLCKMIAGFRSHRERAQARNSQRKTAGRARRLKGEGGRGRD